MPSDVLQAVLQHADFTPAVSSYADICHAESSSSAALAVMSRDVVLAPARNDTVPIQEVSVQTACH